MNLGYRTTKMCHAFKWYTIFDRQYPHFNQYIEYAMNTLWIRYLNLFCWTFSNFLVFYFSRKRSLIFFQSCYLNLLVHKTDYLIFWSFFAENRFLKNPENAFWNEISLFKLKCPELKPEKHRMPWGGYIFFCMMSRLKYT